MNYTVPAASGYEASVYFNVDSRAWYPCYRKAGASWATQCAPFGHAHTPKDEVISQAAAAIADHIAIHTGVRS